MCLLCLQADVAGGDKAAEYVLAPQGLFPAPLVAGNCRLPPHAQAMHALPIYATRRLDLAAVMKEPSSPTACVAPLPL